MMNNTYPVFSTLLQPEVLAAASVTRIAFLDDSPLTNKPVVSSVIDISAKARALVTADAATPAASPATETAATPPTASPRAVLTAAQPTTTSTVAAPNVTSHAPANPADPFADASTFAKAQANSYATAQAVAAYYLTTGFGNEAAATGNAMYKLAPIARVGPVNPVARVAALQLGLHA